MALSSSTRRSSSRPALGLLLAGLGILVFSVGMGELPTTAHPLESAMGDAGERTAGSHGVTLAAPSRDTERRAWVDAGSGSGAALRTAQERSRGPAHCLGAELATGQRAESMHLATAPVQRPADCGDGRDALMGLASLVHAGRDIAVDPAPSTVVGAALSEDDGLDLVAAALYGPPDWQPQVAQEALLEEGVPESGRGRARDYLEETAAARWWAPRFQAVLAWEETSGYGTVETSRAAPSGSGTSSPRPLRPTCRTPSARPARAERQPGRRAR